MIAMQDKPLRIGLCALWISYIPVVLLAVFLAWSAKLDVVAMIAVAAASLLAPLCSKIIGVIAIARKYKGIAWQDQSILLQATAIFTISFLVSMLLGYLFVVSLSLLVEPGTTGLPEMYRGTLPPLKWLVNTIIYTYTGLAMCAMFMITIPLMTPPIILLILLIKNKQITKRTFHILTSVSTFGWLVLGFVGLAMLAGCQAAG